MPNAPNCRASRRSRAAWASTRTGTGPSVAAIPPTLSRVIRAVRAPSRAARSAANTPAGPPPMTATSNSLACSIAASETVCNSTTSVLLLVANATHCQGTGSLRHDVHRFFTLRSAQVSQLSMPIAGPPSTVGGGSLRILGVGSRILWRRCLRAGDGRLQGQYRCTDLVACRRDVGRRRHWPRRRGHVVELYSCCAHRVPQVPGEGFVRTSASGGLQSRQGVLQCGRAVPGDLPGTGDLIHRLLLLQLRE